MQKTTSNQFEGRWDGQRARSAYLFFDRENVPDLVSVDVFLDVTSKGLRGNLALVVEGPELSDLEPMKDVLSSIAVAAFERALAHEGFKLLPGRGD